MSKLLIAQDINGVINLQEYVDKIRAHFEEAFEVLSKFIANDDNFTKIEAAGNLIVTSLQQGGKVLSCGNGGSMCDAMHFAEEMTGRFRENRGPLAAIAISDSSHITCAANDYGLQTIFSRMVEGLGSKGDVLLAISTSGNSENIINAAKAARNKGMKVIGLTGKTGGKLPELCDVELRVPHFSWSDRIQEIHIKIIHTLIDYVETNIHK